MPPELNRPEALAATAAGNLLICNQGTSQVLRRQPDGRISLAAGTGTAGYAGDNGPAVDAELSDPGGLAVGDDGTVYVADTGNNRVRAISPAGVITTIAGNGGTGSPGGSGGATAVTVSQPVAVAFARGRLYVADDAGVQVVVNGVISTVIAAGPGAVMIDGAQVALFPSAITVDLAGDLFVADSSPKLLIEFSPTGRVLHQWEVYVSPAGVVTAPDGSVLVADYGNFAIKRLVGGRLVPLVTFSAESVPGLIGAFRPSGLAAGGDGAVFADTDGVNAGTNQPGLITVSTDGRVRLLVPQPSVSVSPSEGLLDRQVISVSVGGYGPGEKVFLSECSSAAAVNPQGCGEQLAAQPFIVTGDGGGGTTSFVVRTIGYSKPDDTTAMATCRRACVLLATTNIAGAGIADAALGFR